MSIHTHHETNQEQRSKKEHDAQPIHYDPYQSNGAVKSQDISTKEDHEKTSDQISKSKKSKDVLTKMPADDIAIRQLAYEIFKEKGGSDLDNWFEAEEALNQNF